MHTWPVNNTWWLFRHSWPICYEYRPIRSLLKSLAAYYFHHPCQSPAIGLDVENAISWDCKSFDSNDLTSIYDYVFTSPLHKYVPNRTKNSALGLQMFILTKSVSRPHIFLALRSEYIRELVFLPIGVYGFSSYLPFIDYVMIKAVSSGRHKLLEIQKIPEQCSMHLILT